MGLRHRWIAAASAVALALGIPVAAHAAPVDAAGCRAVPVPADVPLRSAEARAAFGVDGTGVTVGIISGSFDTGQVPDAAADVLAGVLPGAGNPCGRTTSVRVLMESDLADTDEGRAMAQIVHGIAPGAELLFASANDDYVLAVGTLVDAGADVIVDDVGAYAELAFQRDAIGVAVQDAVDRGVLYIAAAGNDGVVGAPGYPSAGYPIGAWATAAYRPVPCDPVVAALYPPASVDCLDVDPGEGVDPLLGVTIDDGVIAVPRLVWGEPAGAVTTTLEHVVVAGGVVVGRAGMTDPGVPYVAGGIVGAAATPEQEVAIVRRLDVGAPGTPPVRWVLQGIAETSILDLEYFRNAGDDVIGGTIIGHEADPATLAVAAVDIADMTLETFSSAGPSTFLFRPVGDAPAPALAEPIVTPGPAVASVQRLPISFPLDGSTTFAGTSAAAPTVAAVAALALQATPGTTPQTLRAALESTADPAVITSPYPADIDVIRMTGAGLVDAYALVGMLRPPALSPSPDPRLADSGPTSGGAVAVVGALLLTVGMLLVRTRVRRRG